MWSISQDGMMIIWDVQEVEEGVRGSVTLKKLDGGHAGEVRGAVVVPGESAPFVWFVFFVLFYFVTISFIYLVSIYLFIYL